MARQFVEAHRFLEVGLHQRHRLLELRLAGPQVQAQRDALAVVLAADPLARELLRDRDREVTTLLLADQVEHHVERRGAARTGVAVAVDLEDPGGHDDLRKLLAHAGEVLPVNRCPVTGQQIRQRQRVGAGAQPAEGGPALGLLAQPLQQFARDVALHPFAAANQYRVERSGLLDGERGFDLDAIAGGDRGVVDRQHDPLVEGPPGDAVGHAQRFQRGAERQLGEFGNQYEPNAMRCGLLRLCAVVTHACELRI